MLRSLKELFDSLLAPPLAHGGPGGGTTPLHRLHLATAVLLVEVMRADTDCSEAERRAVLGVLQRRFALADDEQAQLLALAEHSAKNAVDFHAFTSTLNEQLAFEDKVQMVEAMWAVACSDGIAISALFNAADEDSATGGPDLVRGIYPTMATITDEGFARVEEEEIAERFRALVGRLSTPDSTTAAGATPSIGGPLA